jgi:predicted ATP-dependent protease
MKRSIAIHGVQSVTVQRRSSRLPTQRQRNATNKRVGASCMASESVDLTALMGTVKSRPAKSAGKLDTAANL